MRVGDVGPAGGAAVAAMVGGDDVVSCVGERGHDFTPGVGQLRIAMEEK